MSEMLSDVLQTTGAVAPVSLATATNLLSSYFECRMFERVMGLVQLADMTLAGTLTCQLMQATDTSGTSAKVLGTAGTAVAVSNNEDLLAVQEVRAQQFDTAGGFHTVAIRITHDHGANRNVSATLVRNAPHEAQVSRMGIT